jgi:hypothetical protein
VAMRPRKQAPPGRGDVSGEAAAVQDKGVAKVQPPGEKAHTETRPIPRNPGTCRAACEELGHMEIGVQTWVARAVG